MEPIVGGRVYTIGSSNFNDIAFQSRRREYQ